MRKIGILTTGVVMIAAAGAVVLGVMSKDDVKRYLKMRNM